MKKRVQLLVAAVEQNAGLLAERMHICSDAVIVNQCGRYGYEEFEREGHRIQVFSMAERGVGLSFKRCSAILSLDKSTPFSSLKFWINQSIILLSKSSPPR